MKKTLVISAITALIACSHQVNETKTTTLKIKYTFSAPNPISFGGSSASYSILFRDSVPIDTFLTSDNAYIIGNDSILYQQVGISNDLQGEEDSGTKGKTINGRMKHLVIFDGKALHNIKPPYYDSFFSSFYYKDYELYYWGFKDEITLACRYNIKTKSLKKLLLTKEEWGTDFPGAFFPPKFNGNNILFESNIRDSKWLIDSKFQKIIQKSREQAVKPDTTNMD